MACQNPSGYLGPPVITHTQRSPCKIAAMYIVYYTLKRTVLWL
jgi:hypothetical protein